MAEIFPTYLIRSLRHLQLKSHRLAPPTDCNGGMQVQEQPSLYGTGNHSAKGYIHNNPASCNIKPSQDLNDQNSRSCPRTLFAIKQLPTEIRIPPPLRLPSQQEPVSNSQKSQGN